MHECVRLAVSWIEPYEEINGKITIDCLSIPVVFTYFTFFFVVRLFFDIKATRCTAHLEHRTTNEPPKKKYKKLSQLKWMQLGADRDALLFFFFFSSIDCWFYYSKRKTINGHVNREAQDRILSHRVEVVRRGRVWIIFFFLSVIWDNAHNRMLLLPRQLTILLPSQSQFLPLTPRHSERCIHNHIYRVFNDAFHSIAN